LAKSSEIPGELTKWLTSHNAINLKAERTPTAVIGGSRASDIPISDERFKHYVLTTVDLMNLTFNNHKFNPRTPNQGKVNELKASITQLTMISPLTCSFTEKKNLAPDEEEVMLIDGRHRFDALMLLKKNDPSWLQNARVDVKIYFGLQRSDLHVLATYLNQIRRPLKRGEYYKAIVHIFEEKQKELESSKGIPITESQVFSQIHSRELKDRNFDLSIGRIVGITAYDEEQDDSWFPLVGDHQNAKYEEKGDHRVYYRPLTAANLAEFLRHMCKPGPYGDYGEVRAVEIGNVRKLGRQFRKHILVEKIKDRRTVSRTSVACKFWCLSAFGRLMPTVKSLSGKGESILANPLVAWDVIDDMLIKYSEVMAEQTETIQEYQRSGKLLDLDKAWSYQTQSEKVSLHLRKALEEKGIKFERT
jgi:hypothetical protein